jgi:hypothetical protein
MGLPLQNAKDIQQPWTHWFLAGDTGTGKTTCAATFPAPLFIMPYNEMSIVTLAGTDMPYLTVDGIRSMEKYIGELERDYNRNPDGFPYETIVIESLSHYLDLAIEEITGGNKKNMDQQGWGKLSAHLRNLHARLRNIDVHCVFTSLLSTKVDREGTVTAVEPLMQGQMKYKLPSACDVIGLCTFSPGKPDLYEVHFAPHKKFGARTRFRDMPKHIRNFKFADVEAHLG